MDDASPLYCIAVLLLLTIIDGIFYGFGAAVQALNQNDISRRVEAGDKKAEFLMECIDNPVGLVSTIQVIVTSVSALTGYFEIRNFTRIVYTMIYGGFENVMRTPYYVILVCVAVVVISFLLVFGILVPKRMSVKYSDSMVKILIPVVRVVSFIIYPLTLFLRIATNCACRAVGIKANEDYDNVTEEDIMSMVNEGHEQGVLLASEAEMITNIFQFDDKEAQDIMTHRKNIVAVDEEMTLEEAVDYMLNEKNSRFPVYREDIDDIIGILHVKDAMKVYTGEHDKRNIAIRDIKDLIMEAHFIPETRNINLLFKEMQSQKIHMEVVVDEYGQTSGLVAMEDILEEIVGNILDEYDEEEHFITKQDDNSYIIEGMTPLDEIEEELDIEFTEEDFDTLNGLLISKLDRIPADDEHIEIRYGQYKFDVIDVHNKMINKVLVTKIEEKSEFSEEDDQEAASNEG